MEDQALKIVETLKAHGYQAVYAGGCVRDMLLELKPMDYDVATNATPDIVESLFSKTLAVGKSFGVIVVIMDGFEIEVASFRSDGQYTDGRRPDSVTFSSLEEDAQRRDLTINGLFYDPIKKEIIDCVKGSEDIHDKIIRLIGKPDARIAEDKLRMLRVVRFATRLNFTIDPDTFRAVKEHAEEIKLVSAERIADELQKILRAGNYRKSIELLFDTGLIEHILPEFKAMRGCEQPVDYHPEGDCAEHTILALSHLPVDASDELRMGTLLHDIGKPPTQTYQDRIRFNGHDAVGAGITRKIMERMKFSTDFTNRVVDLVRNHMKFICVQEMKTSTLKKFMTIPYFDEHMMLHQVDCLSSHGSIENINFLKEKFNSFKPEEIRPTRIVSGKDLMEFGLVPGPFFRTILEDVKDKQLEGVLVDRDNALEYIKKIYVTSAV